MLSSIDLLIEQGVRKIGCMGGIEAKTESVNDRIWNNILERAKSHLPVALRPFLCYPPDMIKQGMPPAYLAEFQSWMLIYKTLAPIKVHFSDNPSPRVSYQVPAFDGMDGITYWDWGKSETYTDVELALGDAYRKFELFASKFPNLAK